VKLVCVGRNYSAHIEELENERPLEPVVFIKPDSAVLPREQDFYIPDFSDDIHYEAEVIVRIKKVGKHIREQFAPRYYDQLSLGIDFTARDLQSRLKEKGLPWEKAKGFDGSAVIGHWLPLEELGDPQAIPFYLEVNGSRVQEATTALMLWKIDELIAYVSTFFTLKKGDVIFTGTPAGVGKVRKDDHLRGVINEREVFSIYAR